jgi:hypothetical protein
VTHRGRKFSREEEVGCSIDHYVAAAIDGAYRETSGVLAYPGMETFPPTRSRELTPAQAEALHNQLRPMVQYLNKLLQRMENELRFPPSDPLLGMTKAAYHALRDLLSKTHYLSCRSGGGETAND